MLVEKAFAGDIDYAMLVKIYGKTSAEQARRYSPAEFVRSEQRTVNGYRKQRTFRPATSSGRI